MNHVIPGCVHNSTYWEQPLRDDILVNAEEAVMSQKDFDLLKEYTFTNPTAVYAGRMWKAMDGVTDQWFLRWYGYAVFRGGKEVCFTDQRRISILDWKATLGVS